MTRIYSSLANSDIQSFLDALIDPDSTPQIYREAMRSIGTSLGDAILTHTSNTQDGVRVASLAEDTDLLVKDILLRLDSQLENVSFTCFWNQYFSPFNFEDLEATPIIKKYQEPSRKPITYILFIKSIISKTHIIRTDLTNLLQEIDPEKILIVTPVISPHAEQELKNSFNEIHSKFQFLYFAKDDEFTANGELSPGIGSKTYEHFGLSESTRSKYMPELVKARSTKFVSV